MWIQVCVIAIVQALVPVAEYHLSQAMGQILFDSSGNANHAVNGLTAAVDTDDVTWTDRGGYFEPDSVLSMPRNGAVQFPLSFNQDITVTFWVRMLEDTGRLFAKTSLDSSLQAGSFLLTFSGLVYTQDFDWQSGKTYADEWTFLSFIFNSLDVDTQLKVLKSKSNLFTAVAEWEDDLELHIVGGGFNGFIYHIAYYDEAVSISEYNTGSMYNTGAGCIYPLTESGCLSLCADPTSDSACTPCSCSEGVGCTELGTCLECDALCDGLCANLDAMLCLDFPTEFCGTFPFDAGNVACVWECIDHCDSCDTIDTCLWCSEGAYLTSQEICVLECDEGWYEEGTSRSCEPCNASCLDCSGPLETDCISCPVACSECGDTCEGCSSEPLFLVAGSCLTVVSLTVTASGTTLNITAPEPLKDFSLHSLNLTFEEDYSFDWALNVVSTTEYLILLTFTSELTGAVPVTVWFDSELITTSNKAVRPSDYEATLDLPEPPESASFSTAAIGGVAGLGVALTGGAVSMLTLDDPTALWTILSTSQFLSYLPVLKVPISEELGDFLGSYQTVAFLPNPVLEWMDSNNKTAPAQFVKYGEKKDMYQDTEFVRNAGKWLCLAAVIVAFLTILLCLDKVLTCVYVRKQAAENRKFYLSRILRVVNTLLLDFVIAVVVHLAAASIEDWTDFGAACAGLFLVALPVVVLYSLKYHDSIRQREGNVYRALASFFDELSNKSRCSSAFYAVLNIRRLFYGVSLYYWIDSPLTFLGSQFALSVILIPYYIWGNVFATRPTLSLYCISEVTLGVSFVSLGLSDYVDQDIIDTIVMITNIGFLLTGTLLLGAVALFNKCRGHKKVSPTLKSERGIVVEMNAAGDNTRLQIQTRNWCQNNNRPGKIFVATC